jgi:hypothetical protein
VPAESHTATGIGAGPVDSTAGWRVSDVAVAAPGIPEIQRRRASGVVAGFGLRYQGLVDAAATEGAAGGVPGLDVVDIKAPISADLGLATGRDAAAVWVAASHGQHPLGVAILLLARGVGQVGPAST